MFSGRKSLAASRKAAVVQDARDAGGAKLTDLRSDQRRICSLWFQEVVPGWMAAPRPAEAGDSLSIQHAAAHPRFCTRARLHAYPAENSCTCNQLRLQTCISTDLHCISIIHVIL